MTAKRLVRQNRAGLGISSGSLSNFRLPSGEVILQTAKSSPLWRLVKEELPKLMADLEGDQKHSKRLKRIGELLSDPEMPKIERITFK